mmetsp:Transcript_5582/g.12979  ORF Transcript_5582/g.12979 Transcript_5582/m.12979 type:complete len:429 (+) Transcript_5582:1886-3172(+)
MEDLLPDWRLLEIVHGCIVRLFGDDVGVCRSAERSDPDVLGAVVLNDARDDGVACEVDSHVQLSVKVGVAPEGHRFAATDLGHAFFQPVADLWGLIHYVCSTQLVKFIALLPAESSAHGEGNGSAGVFNLSDDLLPDSRTIEIDSDNVSTKLLEKLERTHRTGCSQKNKVLLRKVAARLVAHNLLDGLTAIRFNGPVLHPAIDLVDEVVAFQHSLLAGVEALVRDLDAQLAGPSLPPLDCVREERSGLLGQGVLEAHRCVVFSDKLELLIHRFQSILSNFNRMLLRLGGDYQVVEDVLRVSEPPVPLLPHLLRHLGIGRLDGPGEDLFRGVSCASFPIFAHWENNSLQLRGRFGVKSFLPLAQHRQVQPGQPPQVVCKEDVKKGNAVRGATLQKSFKARTHAFLEQRQGHIGAKHLACNSDGIQDDES